jgi:hypothetical protein
MEGFLTLRYTGKEKVTGRCTAPYLLGREAVHTYAKLGPEISKGDHQGIKYPISACYNKGET